MVVYPKRIIQAYSFVTVYCMNCIILWCVSLKLFSFSFVFLLAQNPGDANAHWGSLCCPKSTAGFRRKDLEGDREEDGKSREDRGQRRG